MENRDELPMIFCQRCKKPNPTDLEHCEACGTRLMVVANAHEANYFEGIEHAFEEHLLERISILETAVARANSRFEQLLDLAQQQATGTFYDHMMLESLTEILTETHAVDADALESRWRRHVARHYEETAERERLDERCDQIINAFRGTDRNKREDFIDLVEEGTLLISEGRTRRGLRMLEKALTLDETNAELAFTIGEYLFHLGRGKEAAPYLRRAIAKSNTDFGAQLLLGLVNGEHGQAASAREHLEIAVSLDDESFAAHYSLGRVLALEGKLVQALLHLKRALALKPVPEMHYLVGRMYWEQGRKESALRHLQKAIRLDPEFDIALYSLGWMYWQTKRPSEALEHLQAAYEINPHDAQYRAALSAQVDDELPNPPSVGWTNLFPLAGQKRKARLSEVRFVELLIDDLQTLTLSPARRSWRK